MPQGCFAQAQADSSARVAAKTCPPILVWGPCWLHHSSSLEHVWPQPLLHDAGASHLEKIDRLKSVDGHMQFRSAIAHLSGTPRSEVNLRMILAEKPRQDAVTVVEEEQRKTFKDNLQYVPNLAVMVSLSFGSILCQCFHSRGPPSLMSKLLSDC